MSHKKIILMLIISSLLMITFSVYAGNDKYPVTVKDYLNGEITINEKPERIISLAPSVTEMLFALGLDDEIIAVTTYADYPEAALEKEKIGTITEPNIEKIVRLNPDLVVAADINKIETVKKIQELGIKVVGFKPHSIDETINALQKMGKLTGQWQETEKIVGKMYTRLAEIKDLVEAYLKDHKRPRVFYEIWNNPLTTVGNNTFIDDLITTAGGINIGAKARGVWPQYSLEKLLLENPDAYISTPHSAPHRVSESTIKNRQRYKYIKAVKNDRIYIIDQDIVSRPSPRILKGLKLLIKAIFPELADKVDEI